VGHMHPAAGLCHARMLLSITRARLPACCACCRYNKPTVNLKGAVLYWHFVDIVWIAVYGIIYAAQL
jgi:heme/copper-type cytochrome/quinol oxidase subunit 3